MKQAVLLSTHFINGFVLNSYHKLRRSLAADYEVSVLININDRDKLSRLNGVQCYICDLEAVNSLGYNPIRESLLPGSCHFPVLRFYRDYLEYDFYWFIEYDVYFTGSWSALLDDCSRNLQKYDFLSSQIERFDLNTNGRWPWWYDSNKSGFALADSIKGFNPICGYSKDALACLDEFLTRGYSAHSEVMITSCLYHAGMKIGDFGGSGIFVPKGYEHKYHYKNYHYAEDYKLWSDITRIGGSIYVIPKCLIKYRVSKKQVSFVHQ